MTFHWLQQSDHRFLIADGMQYHLLYWPNGRTESLAAPLHVTGFTPRILRCALHSLCWIRYILILSNARHPYFPTTLFLLVIRL